MIQTAPHNVPLEKEPDGQEENNDLFDHEDQRTKRLKNNNIESELNLREKYAQRSFYFAILWLIFLIALTFSQFVFRNEKIGLKEAEFLAVSTTTTAAVFGFWAIVLRSLFPSKAQETKKQ
jgi:hypothetical protein